MKTLTVIFWQKTAEESNKNIMKNVTLLKSIGKIIICKNHIYHRNKKVKSLLNASSFATQKKIRRIENYHVNKTQIPVISSFTAS